MNQGQIALLAWTVATLIGTVVGTLALVEIRRNWLAVEQTYRRPYSRVLHEIVLGNLYQQGGRLVMEFICWAAVLFALFGTSETRGQVILWLLVAYRVMHTWNSLMEYLANDRRRRHRQTREGKRA